MSEDYTHEVWKEIEDFPGYSVSDFGRVRNDKTGKILVLTKTQQGLVKVGLVKDGAQWSRSVALLVATAHLERPIGLDYYDTPINLDGNRENNRLENLMWRPRWFAVKYHKQFDDAARKGYIVPIQALGTGEIYANSMEAAMRYGILAEDTVKSVLQNTYVFPTYQKFKVM